MDMYPIPDFVMSLFVRTDVSPMLIEMIYDVLFGSTFKIIHSAKEWVDFKMNDDNPQPADAYLNQLNAVKSFDLRSKVEKLKLPTLIVAGDEDLVIPPKNAQWLHEHIKGSKMVMLETVGHMIPLESPERLTKLVQDLCL